MANARWTTRTATQRVLRAKDSRAVDHLVRSHRGGRSLWGARLLDVVKQRRQLRAGRLKIAQRCVVAPAQRGDGKPTNADACARPALQHRVWPTHPAPNPWRELLGLVKRDRLGAQQIAHDDPVRRDEQPPSGVSTAQSLTSGGEQQEKPCRHQTASLAMPRPGRHRRRGADERPEHTSHGHSALKPSKPCRYLPSAQPDIRLDHDAQPRRKRVSHGLHIKGIDATDRRV